MSHFFRTSQKNLSAVALLLSAFLLAQAPVSAQSSADTDKDGKISDAERAKRDADKVFSFIKFHTVRPAAPAAAAPRPAPRPAPVAAAAATVPAISRAVAAPAAVSAAAPAAANTAVAAAPEQALAQASPVTTAAAPALAAASTLSPNASLPPTPQPQAPQTQPQTHPVPEPEPEPEEEVPLKLIAYVAPEMNAQVLAAMNASQVVVPVRFVVEPDGKVSSAVVRGSAPRRVGQAAVRAVQQWRFDKIPALREVDVEIAFKAAE